MLDKSFYILYEIYINFFELFVIFFNTVCVEKIIVNDILYCLVKKSYYTNSINFIYLREQPFFRLIEL